MCRLRLLLASVCLGLVMLGCGSLSVTVSPFRDMTPEEVRALQAERLAATGFLRSGTRHVSGSARIYPLFPVLFVLRAAGGFTIDGVVSEYVAISGWNVPMYPPLFRSATGAAFIGTGERTEVTRSLGLALLFDWASRSDRGRRQSYQLKLLKIPLLGSVFEVGLNKTGRRDRILVFEFGKGWRSGYSHAVEFEELFGNWEMGDL